MRPRRPRRQVTTEIELPVDTTLVDADGEEPETGPFRRCIVTRERLPKEQMFRFVIGPNRDLVPDLAGKLPGRGIWLSASGDVLESGGARGRELIRAFARAARGPIQMPPDLPVVLQMALVRRISDFLGLARRAGQAIAGFEKARDWMKSHPAGLILQAADGSETERTRFRSAVPETVPVLTPLTGAEMGHVFGHDHVVHVAVAPGKLATAIMTEAGRLIGLASRQSARGQTARDETAREMTRETAPELPREAAATQTSHRAAERATAGTNDVTGTNG